MEKVQAEVEERGGQSPAGKMDVFFHPYASRAGGRQSWRFFRFSSVLFPLGTRVGQVSRAASRMLICHVHAFSQVGELASSKSAIQHCAPELSALIAILRSTGPVINGSTSSAA